MATIALSAPSSPAYYINKAIADVESASYIGSGKQQNALLDKLNNALSAMQTDPPYTTHALLVMNDFYIILCNMKKQGKIDSSTYTMLYNNYVSIVTSLGGTPEPAC